MNISRYKLTIQHDKGLFTVETVATSIQAAKQIVMNAESCPESAIVFVESVFTLHQS